jgi:hypothetical protein
MFGAGAIYDAEAVFRYYVKAAALGVEGLIWFDLRDDGNDPDQPDQLRGLIQRDFSPKHGVVGFAAAARALTGARYAGPVFGTPPEFDSAYFITADRHLAVQLPHPNRARPAVLAPFSDVPGELRVMDYLASPRSVLRTPMGPLVQPLDRPFVVTLALANADPDPQLGFAKPWLKLPSRVYLDGDAKLELELTAPMPLRGSFVRVVVPRDVPLSSSITARALKAAAGETLSQEIVLTAADERFDRATVTVDLSLEGERVELPVEVIRQTPVKRRRLGQNIAVPEFRLIELGGRNATATVEVFGGYQLDQLALAIRVEDDAMVPYDGKSGRGDALLVGLALEGQDRHVELRLETASPGANAGRDDGAPPEQLLSAIHGTPPSWVGAWRVSVESDQGERTWLLTIPAASLGVDRLLENARLRIALRYLDDDGSALREDHVWGGGLDGSRSTEPFAVLHLAGRGE